MDNVLPVSPPAQGGEALFLLKLSREDQYLDIESFRKEQLIDALTRYDSFEDLIETELNGQKQEDQAGCGDDNVVLAYARNPDQLQFAYPNYSTNVDQFVAKVRGYL